MEEIPFKDYEEIRIVANRFLAKYHKSGEIPVPIEEIVEFDLKLDIIPIPGLQDVMETDGLTTDGFIYGDLSAIAVDEFVYEKRPTRYRFTLAHEVGHFILHPQCLDSKVTSIDEWKDYIDNISDQQYGIMEWQANCFAGLVLAPADKLKEIIAEAIEEARKIESSSNVPNDFIIELLEKSVASYFDVSVQVIHIRMEKDNLADVFNPKDVLGRGEY